MLLHADAFTHRHFLRHRRNPFLDLRTEQKADAQKRASIAAPERNVHTDIDFATEARLKIGVLWTGGPVTFRRVYGLESHSRIAGNRTTTGSLLKRVATPTAVRGRLEVVIFDCIRELTCCQPWKRQLVGGEWDSDLLSKYSNGCQLGFRCPKPNLKLAPYICFSWSWQYFQAR